MPLFRLSKSALTPVERTTFASERIRERQDLQRVLFERIDVLGDDLLAITEEYGSFADSRRRIDMLAFDRSGSLVVIELKRTEDGGHMELQALRYAAMVSTMTMEHLIETFAHARAIGLDDARVIILDWLDETLDELPNTVRIILVSADFSTEVTSTVLWLAGNYGLDISCFRLAAYRVQSEIILDIQQIIPLPEANDFQIQQRRKVATPARAAGSGRDYTRYDLSVDGRVLQNVSKQQAVRWTVIECFRAGVPLDVIRSMTARDRWIAVHPESDEDVRQAFIRENPTRSPNHRWFDLDIVVGDDTWTMVALGGIKTEEMLSALSDAASPRVGITWSRASEPTAV